MKIIKRRKPTTKIFINEKRRAIHSEQLPEKNTDKL